MKKTKIGINGFGRIGRQLTKAILQNYSNEIQIVAINDLAPISNCAHLFKYDSTYGNFQGNIDSDDNYLIINNEKIKVFSEKSPSEIPWEQENVEIVVESTGFFTDASDAGNHLSKSVKKVIISAPSTNEDLTLVLGVNQDKYDPKSHHIISNASCTTNCVAPMVKVIHDSFGVENALMSTIHSYTNDQKILDQMHSDLRRARSAAENIIPTTTGAAKAVTKVIPELEGKIDGMAYRVPTSTVSVTDLTLTLKNKANSNDINSEFEKFSKNDLKGILNYSNEPLVSSDFRGSPYSVTIDGLSTSFVGNDFLKIVGWYDNEWGYASRTADVVSLLATKK